MGETLWSHRQAELPGEWFEQDSPESGGGRRRYKPTDALVEEVWKRVEWPSDAATIGNLRKHSSFDFQRRLGTYPASHLALPFQDEMELIRLLADRFAGQTQTAVLNTTSLDSHISYLTETTLPELYQNLGLAKGQGSAKVIAENTSRQITEAIAAITGLAPAPVKGQRV